MVPKISLKKIPMAIAKTVKPVADEYLNAALTKVLRYFDASDLVPKTFLSQRMGGVKNGTNYEKSDSGAEFKLVVAWLHTLDRTLRATLKCGNEPLLVRKKAVISHLLEHILDNYPNLGSEGLKGRKAAVSSNLSKMWERFMQVSKRRWRGWMVRPVVYVTNKGHAQSDNSGYFLLFGVLPRELPREEFLSTAGMYEGMRTKEAGEITPSFFFRRRKQKRSAATRNPRNASRKLSSARTSRISKKRSVRSF